MADVATFSRFGELPFEIREQIWQYALPENQNVVTVKNALDRGTDLMYLRGPAPRCLLDETKASAWTFHGISASYQPPALLHACRQSRAIGLKSYPRCFEIQLGIPVLFNLSKDLLLFVDDNTFRRFLKTSLNTYGTNVFGVQADLRFLGICGPILCEPSHHETTHSRLYLFDQLQELILENWTPLPNTQLNPRYVRDIKEVWTARRTRAAKKLKGHVSEEDLRLPKVSFLSLEEIRHLTRLNRSQEKATGRTML